VCQIPSPEDWPIIAVFRNHARCHLTCAREGGCPHGVFDVWLAGLSIEGKGLQWSPPEVLLASVRQGRPKGGRDFRRDELPDDIRISARGHRPRKKFDL
jgi:hypothetical protein